MKQYLSPMILVIEADACAHILSGSGPVGNTDPFTAPGFDGYDFQQ